VYLAINIKKGDILNKNNQMSNKLLEKLNDIDKEFNTLSLPRSNNNTSILESKRQLKGYIVPPSADFNPEDEKQYLLTLSKIKSK